MPKDGVEWYVMLLFIDTEKNLSGESDTCIIKMHVDHLAI